MFSGSSTLPKLDSARLISQVPMNGFSACAARKKLANKKTEATGVAAILEFMTVCSCSGCLLLSGFIEVSCRRRFQVRRIFCAVDIPGVAPGEYPSCWDPPPQATLAAIGLIQGDQGNAGQRDLKQEGLMQNRLRCPEDAGKGAAITLRNCFQGGLLLPHFSRGSQTAQAGKEGSGTFSDGKCPSPLFLRRPTVTWDPQQVACLPRSTPV